MQPSQQMIDNQSGRYLPVIYPEELPYWEGARKRELWLQRCKGCGNSFVRRSAKGMAAFEYLYGHQ